MMGKMDIEKYRPINRLKLTFTLFPTINRYPIQINVQGLQTSHYKHVPEQNPLPAIHIMLSQFQGMEKIFAQSAGGVSN